MNSWSDQQEFLNEEHCHIFERTEHIPDRQEPGDSYKLYEMGYRAGDVILEIGTYNGRSAVVELEGALASRNLSTKPQYFGISPNIEGVWRTFNTIKKFGLNDYCLLFHGTLNEFVQEFSIQPTMVFFNGSYQYDDARNDLLLLKDFLVAGTPILCHNYTNRENETGGMGVRQAVNEFIGEGYAKFIGTFGCSIFMVATDQCGGVAIPRLSEQKFSERKAKIQEIGDFLCNSIEYIQTLESSLEQSQTHIQTLESSLERSRFRVQTLKSNLKRSRSRVQAVRSDLDRSQSLIQAMESSKFWKMRSIWFKIRKIFGLTAIS